MSMILAKRTSSVGHHGNNTPQTVAPSNACFYDLTEVKESNHDQLYHHSNRSTPKTFWEVYLERRREKQLREQVTITSYKHLL